MLPMPRTPGDALATMAACDVNSWTDAALDSAFLSCSVDHFGTSVSSFHTSLQTPGDTLRTWDVLSSADRRTAWAAAFAALTELAGPVTPTADRATCLAPSIDWATPRPSRDGHPDQELTFGTCAVIGSGAALRGRGLGPQIDAHDVVIHVNNRPDPSDRNDMGSRTDILFTTPNAYQGLGDCGGTAPFMRDGNCMLGIEYMHVGEDRCCTGDPCRYDVCTVQGVLFKSYDGYPIHCPVPGQEWTAREYMERASSSSLIALGQAAPFTGQLATHFRREGSPYHGVPAPGTHEQPGDPSTGLHAVITMAFACTNVTLFGFRGSSTIDGHHGGYAGHSIAAEHLLLQDLADHTVAAEHFVQPAYYERWRTVNLGYGPY